MIAAVRSRNPRSTPRRMANGSNSAAAGAIRDHATNAGAMPASTAILMKRYGTPQMTELRMKKDQARGVIGGRSLFRGAGRNRTDESRFCRPLPYHLATAPGRQKSLIHDTFS